MGWRVRFLVLQVDMDVKVTRFLLEPRPELKSVGWEKLLPGAGYSFDYMTGNHFQITQSPHVGLLGLLLISSVTVTNADDNSQVESLGKILQKIVS